MLVLHMPCEDNKQKVQQDSTDTAVDKCTTVLTQLCPLQGDAVLHCSHVIELVTKLSTMAGKTHYINIKPGR